MAERRENTLYERKSKKKRQETNMLGNDQESYWNLKKQKTKNFFVRKYERGGMGQKMGNVKQNTSPLFLGSRNFREQNR